MPTFFPETSILPSRIAARGTAEEGSMMIFIRSQINLMACTIASSETVTMSSTCSRINAKEFGPREVKSPSQIVFGLTDGTMDPSLKDL